MDHTAHLLGRSLLTLSDFSAADIRLLLDLAHQAKADRRAGRVRQRFRGLSLAMLYEKPSTRTRCAFDTAFGEEGGHPVFLTAQEIHLGVKESLEDTARVLGRMFDAIQFRGFRQQTVEVLAGCSGVPVYNGLTDARHPTQVLADLMTLEEHYGKIAGLKLAYVGDCRNNVASSLMIGCARMGVNFVAVGPAELAPAAALLEQCAEYAAGSGGGVASGTDPELVAGADALYTDVWVSMGEEAKAVERLRLLRPFQVDGAMLTRTGNDACLFMHDLPAVKGNEVTEEVFEGRASVVWDQAENRKHTAKAVLLATLPLHGCPT
jgi:ornithine carbamoyltransferase